ncbi:DUF6042 family protein [Streptomyces sp. NPDC003090]|uniref:DUF6042 family protein n=1 Tax=Streptomyces sp. NPDC003090 TaxID=3154274 RepID=UPI003807936C
MNRQRPSPPWTGWRQPQARTSTTSPLALAELVKSGDARVQRGEEPADAERLEAHRRFRLVMDWEHFHDNRIQVSRG